jgi:urea transport system permease protein
MHRIFLLLLLLIISGQGYAIKIEINEDDNLKLISLINQLPKTKLRNMAVLIERISQTKKPTTRNVLQFMLDGELYFLKANKQLVRAQVTANTRYQLTDILTAKKLTEVKKSRISKVKTNNRLRSKLRSIIAKIDLTDENKKVRLQAVQQLLSSPNKEYTAIITELIDTEKNHDVKALMATTLSLQQLKVGNFAEKIEALTQLSSSLQPTVKNEVVRLLTNLPEKELSAQQQNLKELLSSTLDEIESQASFYGAVDPVFLLKLRLTITVGGHWFDYYLWSDGRNQYGSRRNDLVRGLHHLCYALLAFAVDLVWVCICGILSLGHGDLLH